MSQMNTLLGKTLVRVLILYAYGLFVAWIFTLIEKRDETAHATMVRVLRELREEMVLKYNMTENDFDRFKKKTENAVRSGDELEWTFLNSAGFVFAALTTIGYGHMTPKTSLGQGITILFCLIGIPLTMLAMKSAGELWASCIEFLVRTTETRLLKSPQPMHVKKKTLLVACTLSVLLLILAAVSTTHLENWSFMEGLYAWFITLTTIGFGDYVHLEAFQREVDQGKASPSNLVLYGFLLSLPYMIGLSLVSCILSILVDSIEHIRNFRDRILSCSKEPRNDATGEDGQNDGPAQNVTTTAV